MFEKKVKRFKTKSKESFNDSYIYIIVDTYTGVNYLYTMGMGGSNLTPLLDECGQVVIDKDL